MSFSSETLRLPARWARFPISTFDLQGNWITAEVLKPCIKEDKVIMENNEPFSENLQSGLTYKNEANLSGVSWPQ